MKRGWEECKTCEGTGEVIAIDDETGEETLVTCGACGGEGGTVTDDD